MFLFNLKYWKSKIQFFNHNMWNTKEKRECKIVCINSLQICSDTVSDKTYIFLRSNSRKYDWNLKISSFKQNIWDTKKKRWWKIICLNEVYQFSRNCLTRCIFYLLTLNIENQKFNFFFHLKSKKNLVTLRKCNSVLQYYKTDLASVSNYKK